MPANSSTRRGRPFVKGYDARRHRFTAEECRLGFYAALASIAERNPTANLRNVMQWFQAKRTAQKGVCHV
jgi:hypothetical protein